MNMIDIHMHNTANEADGVIAAARRNGAEAIVLLGDVLRFGAYPTESQVAELNDDTIRKVEASSGFCYGFCFLNPLNSLSFCLAEMDRCIKGHGFKGVKLEISLNCRDQRLAPIMREIERLNVPLLHHCWYKTTEKCEAESDPSDVAWLAKQFPSVKIIMAHLTGCGHLGVEDIADCPNVHVDTSGGQPVAGLVEYAAKRLGVSRILFGSDAPYRDVACQLGRICGADLSDAEKRKILHDNAKELLGI